MYVGTVRRRGFGDAASTFQVGAGIASPVAATVGGTAIGSAVGIGASLAIPIVGAAIAGVTLAITELIKNSGCGVTCVETSSWANQAEPLLRQNLNAYFGLAKPRPQSAQQAALANFDAIWNQLVQLCSQPGTGNAGKRCISDRQSGACTWKQNATYSADIMAAGEPQSGQCWNWYSGYRDPIANDPNVVPDAQAAVSSSSGSLFSSGGNSSALGLLALAALVIAGVYFL